MCPFEHFSITMWPVNQFTLVYFSFVLRSDRTNKMENSQQTSSSKSQVPRMKIMQSLQKYSATAGISSELTLQPYPLNGKILMGFSNLCITFICLIEPIFYEPEIPFKYLESCCLGSFLIVIISVLTIILLKVKTLFKLIEDCENIVNASEYSISELLFSSV